MNYSPSAIRRSWPGNPWEVPTPRAQERVSLLLGEAFVPRSESSTRCMGPWPVEYRNARRGLVAGKSCADHGIVKPSVRNERLPTCATKERGKRSTSASSTRLVVCMWATLTGCVSVAVGESIISACPNGNTEKTKTIWLIRAVKLVLRASMDRSGERAPIVRNAAITTNRRAVSGSVLFVGFQVIETW